MEKFAFTVSVLLLVATPPLVLAKLLHGLVTRRLTFARAGSRRSRAELVAWPLLGAVDAHLLALLSGFANQAEDLCTPLRPELGTEVYITDGGFFDYPVDVRCVWPGHESVGVTPWPLNALTALFLAAALAAAIYSVRKLFGSSARPTSRSPRCG